MFQTLRIMIQIFWILDVLDMPFMEMFDTTYPINGVAWFLIWFAILIEPSIGGED